MWNAGQPLLSGDNFKHAYRSLRINVGDEVFVVFDQRRYLAKVVQIKDQELQLELIREDIDSYAITAKITLFQGLPKGDKTDYIIQKNVEIGVDEIVFVEMEHCVAKWKGNQKKAMRFQKIAEEAAKQSKRLGIPSSNEVISVEELFTRLKKDFDHVVIAYEDEQKTLLRDLSHEYKLAGRLAVIVGPEGGISEEEIQRLKELGGHCVSLGPTIMRTETAGIVANTILIQNSIKRVI